MRDVLMITRWFSEIPNLRDYVVLGILGGVISAAVIRLISHFSGSDPAFEQVDKTTGSSVVQTAERYGAAWRDRRLRMCVFKAVQISFFPMILIIWYLFSIHPESRRLILAFPAWFIGYMAAGIWLNRFRCPRCGQLYYWRVKLKGSMERQERWRDCHHCGLQQDQCPST
jgi:predicted RNA-binding Zn-ribbon protein involved in translation (DUF1610 family)